MRKPEQSPAQLTEGVWPPPPTASPLPASSANRSHWFRPAFWLPLAFNIAACVPALLLLKEPSGSSLMSDDLEADPMFSVVSVALLTLLVGLPLAVLQIRRRRWWGQSIWAESVGFALCFTPLPVGLGLLSFIVKAKAFESLG